MSLHGLTAHFFVSLNNITPSGWTTVSIFIHLLKDTLLVSKVLATVNKRALNIYIVSIEVITEATFFKKAFLHSVFFMLRYFYIIYER